MYVHVPQASRNAKKLSEQLVEVVREAKKSDKSLTHTDVTQAFRLTLMKVSEELGGMAHRTQILIVIAIAAAVALGGILMAIFGG